LSHQNTVFHQLLKPILRQDFERLAKQYHQGQKLRSATRWDQFIAILMSQLSCRQSLRDIESNLESQQEKLYHLGAKRIARSTLARINEEQPASLYQQLFIQLLQHCENSKIAHKFRFKNPLYSLDASHIDLSLSLCEWAKVHESKASIKLTVGLNHSNTIPEFVALGDGIENDMVQGLRLKFPPGSLYEDTQITNKRQTLQDARPTSIEVNFVWNYVNDLCFKHLQRKQQFFSAYDIAKYTKGTSKECNLHSQTIQAVTEELVTRRKQFKKAKLKWRVSNKKSARRSLGWIPFKKVAIKYADGYVQYGKHQFKLWDSYGLSKYNVKTGSFVEDSRGRWYVCLLLIQHSTRENNS
jgi:hypothetical protein